MVRAAAAGLVNFETADPYDGWWWRRLNWILGELERQNELHVYDARHRHWLGLAIIGGYEAASGEKPAEVAERYLTRIQRTLYPWEKEATPRDVVSSGRQDWNEFYGDMDSPETKAMIQQAIDYLRNTRAQPPEGASHGS